MSDEQYTPEKMIAAESWWIAAVTRTLLPFVFPDQVFHWSSANNMWRATHVPPSDGGDVFNEAPKPPRARIEVQGDSTVTTIRVLAPMTERQEWDRLIRRLEDTAGAARQQRRSSGVLTVDEAIEQYYRRKAQDDKVTLRDIAKFTGFSEAYLRKKKVEYDRDGGWGSKKQRITLR